MKSCKYLLSFVAAICGSVVLTGCGSGINGIALPETSATPALTPIGDLVGSNYGGHAPLAGAHIYLVEPGNTGYGSAVKSLLTQNGNTVANGSWTNSTYATDQFVPSGTYGVQADANGAYLLSGDYTCDAGRPVWVIGYGGSPTFPSASNAFQTSQIVVGNLQGTGSSETGTYTYTTTTTENFYIGEQVTFSSYTGSFAGTNGTVGTVLSTNLTTTTFAVTAADANGTVAAGTYTTTGTVTASPVFNPAAVNVASLGICPSSGTLAGSISYIYMNEISTAAWAFAFNQFANWSVNDQSGNNEFNLGAPATTMAQQALVNASRSAANLYDIEGSSISTTYAGEGHIARIQTPSGAGIVPRDELDTLGNILAACVDSNNTYRLQAGTVSPQCNTLETYATDNGVYDSTTTIQTTTQSHVAFNIAQAALNIAHYPQGNGTGTTNSNGVQTITSAGTSTTAANFVGALYALPTGNPPFAPNLVSDGSGQPNDFSIGINWQTSPYAVSGTPPSNPFNNSTGNTGSTTNVAGVGEVGIDGNGNAFFPNTTSPDTQATAVTYQLTPSGYYSSYSETYYVGTGTTPTTGVAIDTSNNVFVSATHGVMEYAAPSYTTFDYSGDVGYVVSTGYVTSNSAQVALDNSGYIYIANLNQNNPAGDVAGDTGTQLVKMPATPGTTTTTFTINGGGTGANTATSCPSYMSYVTLDQNNNIWTTNQNTAAAPYATVCRFSNSGTLQYSYNPTPGSATGVPNEIAIDSGNNAWFADKGSNKLIEVLSGATSASGAQGAATVYTAASGVLNAPKGVAVDGKNTIWVTNTGNASISQFSDTGALMSPTYYVGHGFDTVTGGGTPSAQFAVIDQAGNLWSSDVAHGEVIEWIGIAAPTVQPLAQQRAGHRSRQRPRNRSATVANSS